MSAGGMTGGYCGTHGYFTATTAGGCPQCAPAATYTCLLCGAKNAPYPHVCPVFASPSSPPGPDATPTPTEREATEREQRAYARGIDRRTRDMVGTPLSDRAREDYTQESRRLYPLPRETRRRTWTDKGGYEYRVVDGDVERRTSESEMWIPLPHLTRKAVALADLLAHPTEDV